MSSKNFYGLTGDVTVDGGILNVGNAQLYANTETSNVGVGTTNPEFELDVHGNANVGVLYSTFLHGDGSNIQNIVSSQWEGSPGDPIYYASNVGIANTSPVTKTLQIGSNLYVEETGSNVIHVTGNIYADYLVGDGSQLTGIAASLDQIVDQGNTVSNTIQIVSGQDAVSNIGLVTHEGVGISISNTNPTGEFQFGVGSNLLVNVYSSNVLTVDGNVFAQKMTLGTVTVTPAYNLQQIMTTGATTNQTLVLSNVTTGLTTASNVGIANTAPVHTLDVGSNLYVEDTGSNVLTVTGNVSVSNLQVTERLDVGSNLHIENLRVAEVAANLVTYDSSTGELMDSAGLFSNKLAVVSEQPPVALTGASTVVAKHGTYAIEASSGTVTELFDKNISTVWTTSQSYDTLDGSYIGSTSLAGVSGEWAKITMPYKTILRHVKIESTNSSIKGVTLVGLNADGLTWTDLKTENDLNEETSTIIVNATTHHRTYGLIVRATNIGSTQAEIGDLKLFTESFSIDGGKVEMASSAVMGGETTMDQHGPHSRLPKAMPLKKFPEIVFEEGKFDRNDTTRTYVQAGYKVSASSEFADNGTDLYRAWRAFEQQYTDATHTWISLPASYSTTDGTYYIAASGSSAGSANRTQLTIGGTLRSGEWIELEVPNKLIVNNFSIKGQHDALTRSPKSGYIAASNDGTTWDQLLAFTNITGWSAGESKSFVPDTNTTAAYKYFRILTTATQISDGYLAIQEIELYGYEEDPPAGDTSVDTTFTSIMNTPQTTGAQVYVDGSLGETFTNRVVGPTPTGTATSYVSTGKYWELTGALESNVTLEANTFLEGDQPHAVSVWFNSSNLEANVSNTCVFSVSDQEKLDSLNLDLQSNTWHNLTYAYQGEGGSRVTYLDGRKVAEDQAEDTFGDYPPFEIDTYSLGGYTVDASYWNTGGAAPYYRLAYNMFNGSASGRVTGFHTDNGNYVLNPADANYDATLMTLTDTSGTAHLGHWVSLELPYKLSPSYCEFEHYGSSYRLKDFVILGSNDDPRIVKTGFTLLFSGQAHVDNNGLDKTIHTFTGSGKFKYLILLTKTLNTATSTWIINRLQYYGHHENDLVRLPDPTNVLKYPHIAMTGPAQRGYVVSTDADNGDHPIWNIVDGEFNDRWQAPTVTYPTDGSDTTGGSTTTLADTTTKKGQYLQIESPHKLIVTKYKIFSNTGVAAYRPIKVILLGSNTGGSDWVDLGSGETTPTYSGTNADYAATVSISNTSAYKYHRLVIRAVHSQGIPIVYEWELYGTGVDSIPIQIGGGNIDKVANFRVYDKFIDQNQALEIWDAQKDEFGRAKSSMTLQKGRLGIGTTEPEGRLAVADEPDPDTYGLQEYPPKPLAGYETRIEEHGIYKVSVSGLHVESLRYAGWKAFNDNADGGGEAWITPDPSYNNGAQTFNKRLSSNTLLGEYIVLEFPYKVKIRSAKLHERGGNTNNAPSAGVFYGSNDGVSWTELKSFSGLTYDDGAGVYTDVEINATDYFKKIALVVTNIGSTASTWMGLGELRYFGYREQVTKQSVLHDGQLTLTKSLNVPRIGPALDADDTPRRDRLVVEYNTSTNPTFEGAVRDTSGRGLDGVFYGGASYDATEKALVFDGTDDYISVKASGVKGSSFNTSYSFSIWVKMTNTASAAVFITVGTSASEEMIGLRMANGTTQYFVYHFNGDSASTPTTYGVSQEWRHVASTWDNSHQRIYIDGVLAVEETASSSFLNIPDNPNINLGMRPDGGGSTEYFKGYQSNPKIYDCTLTAEEVKTLYDMGRCDEGHHVVNFSKTRVGIGLGDGEAPRGALDVRGDIYGGMPVFFDVRFTSSPTATYAGNRIVWDTNNDSRGGGFDTATGTFTAPIGGVYKFSYWARGNQVNQGIKMKPRINGSPTFNTTNDGTDQNLRGTAFMGNDGISGSAWTIVPLEAGGTFDLFACSHGTTVTSSLATFYNGFTGEYISSL